MGTLSSFVLLRLTLFRICRYDNIVLTYFQIVVYVTSIYGSLALPSIFFQSALKGLVKIVDIIYLQYMIVLTMFSLT